MQNQILRASSFQRHHLSEDLAHPIPLSSTARAPCIDYLTQQHLSTTTTTVVVHHRLCLPALHPA
jgi:hypothetical protein